MAFPLLHSLSVLLLLLQPFLTFAQTRGKITIGASLSASQNSSSWLSPNGDFAFGFHSLDSNKDLFLLSIWYAKIPQKTIVWFANGDSPAASGTKVELTADQGLVLTSPQGRELWKSDPIIGTVAYGLMNDTGNFVLLSDNTNKLWESFNNPTDTMLPSQIFDNGQFLSSKQSDGNFSKGRFRFELNSNGNLVLTTVNLPSDYTNEPYYESKTNGSSNQLVFNQSGYMYILQEYDQRFALTRRVETSASNFYYRATINFDGVFTQYQHPKNSTGNEGWTAFWSLPDDICKASFVSTGSGTCGFNSVCRLNNRRPICECPRGYTLIDPNDQYGSCKPNYTQSCVDDDEPGSPEDLYDFEVITNTDWPTSDYQLLTPFTEEGCRQSCLHDCMCAVAIFRSGDMCWKKKLPLSNGRFDANLNGKALIKIRKAAQSNGTISIGQQLTAAEKTEPWLSPSKDFAFGFHHLDSKDLFLPAIWYYKIPSKTIVWYASEDNPAPRGSKLKLTADRGLVLEDPKGREIWKSEISMGQAAFGVLYDTGNFLIENTNSKKLWQSFDHPTDTLLPTQKMERGWVVSSRRKEKDFSPGRFQFRLLGDGNAVLNTINLESGFGYDAYFWSNTFDVNRSNAGYRVVFNESGQLYVLRENNQIVSLTPETVSAKENYLRATLSFDGVFIFYSHPKNNSTGDAIWSVSDVLPENICINNDIRKGLGSGICGFNSICSISGTKRPICQCPKGFSLLDPDDVYGSCKPDFIQGCEEDRKKSGEDLYYIEELGNTDWPTSDYEQISPYSKDECVSSCLKDCQCSAAVLRDDTCWKKKLPLCYGKTDRDETGTTFIKIRKVPSGGKKKVDVLIPVVSVLFGSSALINLLLVSACCLGFLVVNRNQFIRPHQEDQGVSYMNLRCFTYKELVEVTCGFKEEIGRGAFGTVYKGFANMGSSNHVAVKRLNRVFQDSEKEFKAEVNGIGQTHHKNLVRLLGYSDEGQNRLLVYEFMSNGTLASFLFGDSKPNWKLRTEIAMGIARGLLYLHEDCCTQIIHCDIKPQNILLDDYYNARISDFGLAKLLTLDQSHTSTAIRGTKGYVAPEWFRNMPITVKVDVYSYGVLLLEIICLRRSIDNEISKVDKAILTDWAYDCYQERTLGALVENDLEALDDMIVLQRFVMVAIWCIQEDPAHRPTMRRVTQMLEGVVEVPIPPCHGP